MSATLLGLIDYLGALDVTLEHMDALKKLGDVVELKQTAQRDVGQYLKYPERIWPNLFAVWKKFNQDGTPKAFLDYIDSLCAEKMQQIPDYKQQLVEVFDRVDRDHNKKLEAKL